MDDIIKLILDECRTMFIESAMNCNNKDYRFKFGVYPSAAIIKYHDKFTRDLVIGNTLMAWTIHKDSIVALTDISIEPKRNPISGMYFSEGVFFFSISSDQNMVNLSMYLGLRYVQIYLYDLDFTNGRVTLTNKRLIAVS